jgi:ABC-2 type transport system permease protein
VEGGPEKIRRGGRVKASRYLKLIGIFAGASVAAKLEYRANFVVSILESIVRGFAAVLGLSVLFGDGKGLGGWSQSEALVLVGIFTLIGGLTGLGIFPNLRRIAEAVRTGSMDFTLLKPLDSQFLVSAREINIFQIPEILIGLGFIVYGLWKHETPNALNLLLAFGLLIAALAIVYSICFMLSTIAFWFVRVENTLELFWGFYQASQFPITVYPGWVRIMFTFFIPVAFITTVPAEALLGRVNIESVLFAFGIAVLLLSVSRAFWQYAVRSYTSASS